VLVESSIDQVFYKSFQFLEVINLISKILDCKDGQDDKENVKILMDDSDIQSINTCYEAYKKF
jgi:hypothetical protein